MKKKIFAIALAVMLFALAIAGSSVAYFTDVEAATNTFTAGDVNITLTYAGEVANEDAALPAIEITDQNVFPGQKIPVNATISNVGSEAAYVGAIITLTDAELANFVSVTGEGDNYPVAIRTFLTGLVSDGYTVKTVTATGSLTIYIIKTAALAGKTNSTTDSCELFKDVKIPTSWNNAEMKAFSDLKISVTAYATQTKGFTEGVTDTAENGTDTAEKAITTAFATAWAGYSSAVTLGN